jgi:hypothetical protein
MRGFPRMAAPMLSGRSDERQEIKSDGNAPSTEHYQSDGSGLLGVAGS